MCVLHRCDNRQCVRPDHLFLGSKKDNSADMVNKGRCVSHGPSGEKHGQAKLKNSEIAEIKELLAIGTSGVGVAGIYGVSPSLISLIKRGKHR